MKTKLLTPVLIITTTTSEYAGLNKYEFKSQAATTLNKANANCSPGVAQTELDINNVRTAISPPLPAIKEIMQIVIDYKMKEVS